MSRVWAMTSTLEQLEVATQCFGERRPGCRTDDLVGVAVYHQGRAPDLCGESGVRRRTAAGRIAGISCSLVVISVSGSVSSAQLTASSICFVECASTNALRRKLSEPA